MMTTIFSLGIALGLNDQPTRRKAKSSARDIEDSSKASIQNEGDRIVDTVATLQAWIDNLAKLTLTLNHRGRLEAYVSLVHYRSKRSRRSVLIGPPARTRSLLECVSKMTR